MVPKLNTHDLVYAKLTLFLNRL